MLTNIKKSALLFIATMSLVVAYAPAVSAACGGQLLTFPAWHEGLSSSSGGGCTLTITKLNDLWIIALNIVEILLQGVAYAATGFLIWGGFKYMKARGDPGRIQNAKDAIMNAIMGLGISLGAVAIVNFISAGISGSSRNGVPVVSAGPAAIASLMNTVVFPIAGAVAVIFIIIGAFQYVTSNGDAGETKTARYTIIYSLVGLVFVIMAFAIVQLILGRFS